ncbi:hypothetical protein R50072_26950 [Simiduia litorea]|uniref:hypothetical protein n=1 Tax=Simiduia litorea TaxID=1435348 RepID=UPI0036F39FA7
MRLIVLLTLAICISGCYSVTTWDGYVEGKNLTLLIIDRSGGAVEGASLICPSDAQKDEYAEQLASLILVGRNTSNESGELDVAYHGFDTGGTYTEFMGYKSGRISGPEIICVVKLKEQKSDPLGLFSLESQQKVIL